MKHSSTILYQRARVCPSMLLAVAVIDGSQVTHPLQSGTSFPATSSSAAVHELHILQHHTHELSLTQTAFHCVHDSTIDNCKLVLLDLNDTAQWMAGSGAPAGLVPSVDGAVRVPNVHLPNVLTPKSQVWAIYPHGHQRTQSAC